ncbi:MAG: CvpA family protein [Pirellulales bacterium]|nr:CvpA family protein [Pirellulales bacterium]
MMLPLAGIFQTLASLLAVAIVLGFIAYGFMHGMFRSVLAGMQALVSFVVTLTFTPMITEVLIAVDMPPSYAFPIAVLILLIGTTVGVHMLVEKYISSESIPLLSMIDKIGGAFVGGAAGYIASGGILITLSLMPLPESYEINHSELQLDLGTPLLRTFARIIEPDSEKRNLLLNGEVWPTISSENGTPQYPEKPLPPEPKDLPAGQTPSPFVPPPPNIWSEPFVDLNNNKQRDDNELVYLDVNKDRQFTENALIAPPEDNDLNRFVGLLERYKENNWWRWRVNQSTWEDLYPVESTVGHPVNVDQARTDSAE